VSAHSGLAFLGVVEPKPVKDLDWHAKDVNLILGLQRDAHHRNSLAAFDSKRDACHGNSLFQIKVLAITVFREG
jgi:hypothetical protein